MRQLGSAWELRVYWGADPLTGRQRYATKTVRVGKREAQRILNEMVVEAERGLTARTTATVGDLLDRWLELARTDFSPRTTREVSGYIDRNLRPALGDVRLSKLMVAGMASPWLGVNPAASASPPRVPLPEISPPTPAELVRLQAAIDVDDPELGVFVRLAAMTGARRSELLALRWADVDLDRRVVTISRGIVDGPDGLVEKDTKTHQARRVALDAATAAVLRDFRRLAAERAQSCGARLPDEAFVFAANVEGNSPWFPDSVSRRFRAACRKAGLTGVRLHDLRHYVATRLLSAGVDVRTVAGRLGHRNAATTLNIYSPFVPESDQQAAELLERLNTPTTDQ